VSWPAVVDDGEWALTIIGVAWAIAWANRGRRRGTGNESTEEDE